MTARLLDRSPDPASEARSPLRELLTLAAPTVAQMASYTLMQFIDTWLLSRFGGNLATGLEPTAAANAGMFSFALISVGFGTLILVNTLVSQAYGREDRRACGQYLWQGIWFAVLYAAILLPLLPRAYGIFRAFDHEPMLAANEAAYLRIMLGCAGLKLVQIAFGQFLLAINRPMAALIATLCGVTVNALAAWVLIYGKLGFHPMGIRGSALGQQIGVLLEMSILIFIALRPSVRRPYFLSDRRPRPRQFLTLIAVGLPAVQLAADVLAWSLFCIWVMAPLGADTMAANSFTFRFFSVSFMPAYGISTAVTALVGRYIGRGQPDIAAQGARLGFFVAASYMLACGVGFFAGRNVLLGLFTSNPEILRIGSVMLIYAAVYQFFDAMYIVYLGALAAAGDTLVPAIATGVLCWAITVGGGRAIAVYVPRWGAAGPWTAATLYGVILGVFMFVRFARGGWKKIQLDPG